MEKKPCPQCGEPNYATSPACWACGAPLTGPRAARPAEPSATPPDATAEPAAGPLQMPGEPGIPTVGMPEPPAAAPGVEPPPDGPGIADAVAASDAEDLKPAEREARALRDKAWVTPPVDVEEGPRGVSEWVAYAFHAVSQSASGFKEALDDYDRRRGRKSGAMSSYGCAVTGMLAALFVAFLVVVISFMARGR